MLNAALMPMRMKPATMTAWVPTRWMMEPVTKEGRNMASTCHWMARFTSEKAMHSWVMFMEDWIISRFISP